MHYSSTVIALAALPAIFAAPHDHSHHGHHHGYEAYKSGINSISASAASAPYDLNNGTLSAAGTGTGTGGNTHYSTVQLQSTQFVTAPSSPESSAAGGSVAEAGASEAGTCGGATATVTLSPTATVTVTAGGAPAESSVESSPAVEASSASSSAAPVTSPIAESATSAPVSSSVAPLTSESQAPEGRAPSSVQVYNSAASSAAPVETASSTPVETSSAPPASSAPANSAAVTPAPSAPAAGNADYCVGTHTVVGTSTIAVPPYTGANYTGGVKGKKKGIVFVDGSQGYQGLVSLANENSNVISWLGNYYSGPPPGLDQSKVEFVPQMYGKQSSGEEWNRNAASAIKNGAKYFLSFGEPGTPNDKNQETPDNGTWTFMDQMQPYASQGVTIGAPGCLGGPQDLIWDEDFLCGCQKKGCSIGFVAGHWFDASAPLEQQVERLKGTVNDYIAIAKGKPVWMDNIWPKGTAADQIAFMKEVIPWLEANPAIERYGWVPMDGTPQYGDPFMNGNTPTEIAQTYLSL